MDIGPKSLYCLSLFSKHASAEAKAIFRESTAIILPTIILCTKCPATRSLLNIRNVVKRCSKMTANTSVVVRTIFLDDVFSRFQDYVVFFRYFRADVLFEIIAWYLARILCSLYQVSCRKCATKYIFYPDNRKRNNRPTLKHGAADFTVKII